MKNLVELCYVSILDELNFFFFYRFEIEGHPHTLEFMDAFRTVSLNGRSFKVDFGGLPMPIISNGKKHYIRFLKLPPGCIAGKTVVAGMRGDLPISQPDQKSDLSQSSLNSLSHMEQDSNSQDSSDLLSSEQGITN